MFGRFPRPQAEPEADQGHASVTRASTHLVPVLSVITSAVGNSGARKRVKKSKFQDGKSMPPPSTVGDGKDDERGRHEPRGVTRTCQRVRRRGQTAGDLPVVLVSCASRQCEGRRPLPLQPRPLPRRSPGAPLPSGPRP